MRSVYCLSAIIFINGSASRRTCFTDSYGFFVSDGMLLCCCGVQGCKRLLRRLLGSASRNDGRVERWGVGFGGAAAKPHPLFNKCESSLRAQRSNLFIVCFVGKFGVGKGRLIARSRSLRRRRSDLLLFCSPLFYGVPIGVGVAIC